MTGAEMPVPDFQRPIARTSINNFPIRFRCDYLSEDCVLWVPQRITRNRQSRGWRIIINHVHGRTRLWVSDGEDSPLRSLQKAWQVLVDQLVVLESPITQAKRTTRPGRKRNENIDTGMDGVLIVRLKGRNGRANQVGVRTIQRIAGVNETSKPVTVDTFHISESRFLEAPRESQMRFRDALCHAAAIRKRFCAEYAIKGPLPSAITLEDVSTSDIPSEPARELQLDSLFETF